MSELDVDYSGKKVVVGLTGRLDSAVAALLLKKQGMDVVGVAIVTTSNDLYRSVEDMPKCHLLNLDEIKQLCAKLNIPFFAADGKSQFDSEVLDPLIARRLSADANNSCFDCNKMRIKILYEKMKKLNADFFATGHYCKVQKNLNSSQYFIHANNDIESDQSYLLAGIEGKYLKHLILPLGELRKQEVEKIAKRFGIMAAPSRDEVNFCYRTANSYLNIAKGKVPKSLVKEGQIQNAETELYHGDHEGVLNYHLGQRDLDFKGIGPADKDLEVVGYDFVSGLLRIGQRSRLEHSGFQLVNLKLGKGLDRTRPMMCFLKSKNSKEYYKSNLFFKNNNSALIEVEESLYPLIHMESFVIFDRNTRNAKIIGVGSVGNIGDFILLDRAEEFRGNAPDDSGDGERSVRYSKIFKF